MQTHEHNHSVDDIDYDEVFEWIEERRAVTSVADTDDDEHHKHHKEDKDNPDEKGKGEQDDEKDGDTGNEESAGTPLME